MKKFDTLLIQHIPNLRRYSRALTGSFHIADDLVQDTLERALNKKKLWKKETSLRLWLFTVMHNIFINQIRRYQRVPQMEILDDTISDNSRNPESHYYRHQLLANINFLPNEQKEIFLLVSLEGFAYDEVATILEIPVGTVMSRLSRAREKLRNSIAAANTVPLRRIK